MTHYRRFTIITPTGAAKPKPLHFMASSLAELRAQPPSVCGKFGRLLLDAQFGDTPADAKPLKGFGGAGVMELVEDHDASTYRAIYTVRFERAIYVLHVFQKKSTTGIATPKAHIDLVRSRLRLAGRHHRERYASMRILGRDHNG